jgi:1-acyl-sn-glycerol-3-phosphate acyltransferase
MILIHIILFVTFVFLILGYSYLLIIPGLIIGYTPLLCYVKTIAQSFLTIILSKGFKINFKLADSNQPIKKLINEEPDKIDIIICNHTSSLDFLFIIRYLHDFEIDSYNFVLKNDITYIPGFGFIMYTNSDIKLNRNWEHDKETLGKQLDKIKTTGKKQVIVIFPEGTRLTEQKLKEGNEFSKKNNLPIYENLMVPKSKGLWFIIKHLKKLNKLGRIWDATIILSKFIKKSIGYSDILGGRIDDVKIVWREVELTDEYNDIEKFKIWLTNLWVIKDDFIKKHKNIFFNQIKLEEENKTKIIIPLIMIIVIIGFLFNKYGRYYLLSSFLLSYILIIFKL